MSRLQTSFVLGYHGCEKATGMRAINGEHQLLHSEEPYDWLGSGTYFWEGDRQRAQEWAEEKQRRGKIKEPFVIGAVIDLGNCLDLLARENTELLRQAHDIYASVQAAAGKAMPVNRNVKKEDDPDGELRFLDCAVLNFMFKRIEETGPTTGVEPYNTVRGYFREGERIFPGSGFHHKNHSQIAVRTTRESIRGYFLPLPLA